MIPSTSRRERTHVAERNACLIWGTPMLAAFYSWRGRPAEGSGVR